MADRTTEPTENTEVFGRILPPESMLLRAYVGEASDGKFNFEMSAGVGSMSPIVHCKETGRWFTLNWEHILTFAVRAGITEPVSVPSGTEGSVVSKERVVTTP